jgi:hypothetical protein
MDPWLESPDVFPDLHSSLITYLGDELNAKLPEPYFARAATRVWVEEQRREPDVSVFDNGDSVPNSAGAVAVLEAGWVAVLDSPQEEPFEETYLEIRSSGDARLVTAIEVLSLANKAPGSAGRAAYRQKQREFLEAGVGLVEIDLLRGGQHSTAVSAKQLREQAGPYAYHVSIAGSVFGRQRYAAPIKLPDRLPAVPVPLLAGQSPVSVELQPLLDRAYDNRRYSRQLRYDSPCDPPLTDDQRAWAEAILRDKGMKT